MISHDKVKYTWVPCKMAIMVAGCPTLQYNLAQEILTRNTRIMQASEFPSTILQVLYLADSARKPTRCSRGTKFHSQTARWPTSIRMPACVTTSTRNIIVYVPAPILLKWSYRTNSLRSREPSPSPGKWSPL